MANNNEKSIAICITALLCLCSACGAGEKYTYVDLVNCLTDLERLALLPHEGEKCAQFSSYDRKSRYDAETGEYKDWLANDDWTGYIRKEGDNYVLAEIEGPGVIWRMWSAITGGGNFKFYFDGSNELGIDMPFADFFDGKHEPFIYSELVNTKSKGLNCYVPIPFQKSCKIVADKNWPVEIIPGKDLGAFYYFTYKTYPKDTILPTFKLKLTEQEKTALKRANKILSNCGFDPKGARIGETVQKRTFKLSPGKSLDVFQTKGPKAITSLKVYLGWAVPAEDHESLRKMSLSICWDDDIFPSVWSPLGDFFGTAPGLNEYKSLPMGMIGSQLYSYWYMPFEKSARICIKNEDTVEREVTVEITTAALTEPIEKYGRFHAKWHRDYLLPEEPQIRKMHDWTLLKTQGRGRFCGTMLHVWHPKGGWWGEGDEKFFVDGEKFPSTYGTGTEDYFGYAWGDPTLFENCYHNQTHSNHIKGQPANVDEGNKGHISLNRWHITDDVPFQKSFEGVIEKYVPNIFPILYASTVYWYQQAGQIDPYLPIESNNRIYWD